MILIAGGTGRLGRILVERLAADGHAVRVLSRSTAGSQPARENVEQVTADVRDSLAVDRAMAGARVVVSALSAFGMQGVTPRQVDFEGNANLILAAEHRGVERFILVSALGASAEHPMELARMKYLAEQRLVESKLCWSILRPSTFIETFQDALCAPLVEKRKALVFGRAKNPINFVSVYDVACFVELALTDPSLARVVTEIGGAENLSLLQFVDTFGSAIGVTAPVKHVPRLAMKVLSQLARPFNPTFARMAQAGLLMDTTDMAFDASELRRRFPHIRWTTAAAAARRDYGSRLATNAVAT